MATPFRSGRAGRLRSSDLRTKKYFGFSQRISRRFFGTEALVESQTDNFNDNSLDTAKWINGGGAQVVEQNQRLEIASTLTAGYYEIESQTWQSFYNSFASIKIPNAGNQSIASLEVYPIQILQRGQLNGLFWLITQNVCYAGYSMSGLGGVFITNFAYNSSTHLFFRIRESNGITYYDTSDGSTWTQRASIPNPFKYSQTKPVLQIGTYAVEISLTTVYFDDYNIGGSGGSFSQSCPETITLVDTTFRTSSRRLTDALTLVDLIAKTTSRTLLDALALVDTVRRTTTRTLLDSLTLVDTFAGKITGRILTDSLTLVDTIAKSTSRTITDAVTLVDTTIRTTTRTLIDSITLVDTFGGFKITIKNLLESVVLVDTMAKFTSRTLADALVLVDTMRRTTTRLLTDSLVLVDTMAKTAGRTLTEAVVLVDTIAKLTTRRLTDALALADTMIRTTTRSLLEAITLVDTFSFSKMVARTYTETIILADSIIKTTSRRITEILSLIDSIITDLIVITPKTIGNWILYSLLGLNKIVKGDSKAHTISTTQTIHVVLLSQRSFTVSASETSNIIRSNTTP